jgi:hypothetical protein
MASTGYLTSIPQPSLPTGAGGDKVFFLNSNTVTTSYTIPVGQNALSTGPLTIGPGVTVTVPSGSAWKVI